MSLFEIKAVCEETTFYSHHIDPITPNTSGVLTISNGHTQTPQVADQTYTVAATTGSDHLVVTGQAGGPSPAVAILYLAPNGDVSAPSGAFSAQGEITVTVAPTVDSQASSALSLLTSNESNQYYRWYANNGSGGGLIDGHLQLYSYNSSTNPIAQVMDVAPQTAETSRPATTFFGAVNIPGQLVLSDGSTAGSRAQQFPNTAVASLQLPLNATGTTVYAFTLPSSFAGKLNYTVTIDKISANVTSSAGPINLTFFLSDTQNSPMNTAKACLQYSTGPTSVTATPFAVSGATFVYSGSSAPAGLYLNVVSSLASTNSSLLTNIAFNATIIAH